MSRIQFPSGEQIRKPRTKFDLIRAVYELVLMLGTAFLFVMAGYFIALDDETAVWALIFGWINLWLARRLR